MCGIAGKLLFDRAACVPESDIRAMLRPIRHRGPDGDGIHLGGNVGLGHCRLSIIDLNTGAQPMANEDETVWLVFNGEIYNFQELRERLVAKGHVFRSRTDTEVILHLYEDLGPDCVNELRGMFAFAIWDSKRRRLFLARDRVGIKPLYYCATKEALLFASEIKALLALPEVPRSLNQEAIDTFWTFQFLPGSPTMLRGILKLLPGHLLLLEAGASPTVKQYWDLQFKPRSEDLTLEGAAEELSALLRQTIRQHMIADVPVGILLSGGMDSSAVLSFAARETNKEISTFTIGFEGSGVIDERPYARLVAKQFDTRHYEVTISCEQFWESLPQLLWHLEEPVCEAPAVALHHVSRLARRHVKVLLSGEGGDEAFGGYPNYPNMLALERLRRLCGPLRGAVGKAMNLVGSTLGDHRLVKYGAFLPMRLEQHYWSRVGSPSAREGVNGAPLYTSRFAAGLTEQGGAEMVDRLYASVAGHQALDKLLYFDTKTWLPDDLLLKADKITMANSLELRVPLLDHKVLEFAASLPPALKVKGRETKRVLKAAFAPVLPEEILRRKKAGFPVPYAAWFAKELLGRTEDLLLDSRSFILSFFRRKAVESLLATHAQEQSFQREVFSLVVLELWHQQFGREAPAVALAPVTV